MSERLRWLIWFAFANGLLASFLAFSNVPAGNIFSNGWPGIFLLLAIPAQLISISLLLSLLVCPFLALRRWPLALTVALSFFWVWIFTVVVDTVVFALYRFHLNGMVWNMLTGGALFEMISFSAGMWLTTALIVAAALGVEIFLAYAVHKLVRGRIIFRVRYVLTCLILATACWYSMFAWSDASGYVPVTSQLAYVPWATPLTMRGFFKRHGFQVSQPQQDMIEPVQHGVLHYPKEEMRCTDAKPFNIVIIVVDSLRSDMLTEEIMPNTSALAARSLNFTNHYSAGNCTRFGIFGLMYGLPGSYWRSMLAEQKGSEFIKEMVRHGYDFSLYASAGLTSPEFDRTVFSDVKSYVTKPPFVATAHAGDTEITTNFIQAISNHKLREPFFGFLFLDAPHNFSHPDGVKRFLPELDSVNYLKLNNDFDPLPFFNLYKNSVYFDDQMISKIVKELASKGYMDRTVLVVTGDHGKEFNELRQNYWGHNSNFSIYQTKVPFVVHWPGRGPARFEHRTSHVDLVPTIMKEVLGCANPFNTYSTGMSLFEEQEDRILQVDSWASRAVIEPHRTIVFGDFGDLQVLDDNYTPLPSQDPDGRAIKESMDWMSRFYRE